MLAAVIALLVAFLGAAVVGTVVPGLFWLTLVGIAGVIFTGAVGVSRILGADDDAPQAARRTDLRLVAAGPRAAHRDVTRGGESGRAA